MSMRHVIVLSSFCVSLALCTEAIAQGARSGGALPADAAQADEARQRAANMARELERLANQARQRQLALQTTDLQRVADLLQALEQQRGTPGGVVVEPIIVEPTLGGLVLEQGGGGRGGRTGGPGAQTTFDPRSNDPMSGPVTANAPFSADAITTVTQTLGDGTNISQRATAKFYRDGTGRIRREQTVMGIDALNPQSPGEPLTITTIDSEPGDPRPYQLDPAARTARRIARASASSPGGTLGVYLTINTPGRVARLGTGVDQLDQPVNFQGLVIPRRGIPSDLRPTDEQLGTRQIEGLKATGRRTTVTIPTDRVGNDRPIQITDERWESPELGLVVYSRYSDPRTGVVEYRLTNINRSEPAANLFTVPSDYTVVEQPGGGRRGGGGGAAPPAAPAPPGQRGGGARGRGAPQQ